MRKTYSAQYNAGTSFKHEKSLVLPHRRKKLHEIQGKKLAKNLHLSTCARKSAEKQHFHFRQKPEIMTSLFFRILFMTSTN